MAFVVVYDANALYGNTLWDLLIRVAQAGLVQAKWTHKILDEMLGNLAANRPDIPAEKLSRLRDLMNAAVRDCRVEGHAAAALVPGAVLLLLILIAVVRRLRISGVAAIAALTLAAAAFVVPVTVQTAADVYQDSPVSAHECM